MASGAALQQLQQRALQAEQIITQLGAQLTTLRQAKIAAACQAEEERLRVENDALRNEVHKLKKDLVAAEIRNGVKQFSVPGKSTIVEAVSVPSQPVSVAKTQPPEAQAKQGKKSEKKQKGGDGGGKKDNKAGGQGGGSDDVPVTAARLNMRIGRIVNVKKHPDADSLYVEEVDVGEEKNRTIVSGLVKFVPLEQMQNRLAVFLVNLKPAKMRGILSEGMIMCASSPEKVEILEIPPGTEVGERVVVEDYPGEPDVLLNPKKKIWEQIQPDLRVNDQGYATYKGKVWKIEGKGIIKATTMTDSIIK